MSQVMSDVMSRGTLPENPVVVVTGASSGMGLAVARSYAERGARLVLNARDEVKLAHAVEGLRPRDVATVIGDLADPTTARRIFETARARFGRVDVLVNSAGIFEPKPFTDYSLADVDKFIQANFRGTLLVCQAMVAELRAQRSGGSIITITSSICMAPLAAVPAAVPNATKGALNALTRSLALEVAQTGIRVNAIAPGLIKTPLHGGPDTDFSQMGHLQPMGHMGEVSDIVAAVHYLASAPFVTGVVLPVDGGASLGHW